MNQSGYLKKNERGSAWTAARIAEGNRKNVAAGQHLNFLSTIVSSFPFFRFPSFSKKGPL